MGHQQLVGCFIVFSFLFPDLTTCSVTMRLFLHGTVGSKPLSSFILNIVYMLLHVFVCVCVSPVPAFSCRILVTAMESQVHHSCDARDASHAWAFSQSQLRHLDRNWLMPKTTTWHFCIRKTHWIWVTPTTDAGYFQSFWSRWSLKWPLTRWILGLQWSSVIVFWLVVWNMFFFHSVENVIIPTDFHSIFQRGRSTTNQIINHH